MSVPTREELARRLRCNAKLMEDGQFTDDVVPLMRRAAALLRAPVGVDREAVLDLVERGRLQGSHGLISQAAADQACDELLAAIRALWEAAAKPR